jgi:hypothetical protein
MVEIVVNVEATTLTIMDLRVQATMKLIIRILLVLASLAMVIANWHNGFFALIASILFLVANVSSLIYNELKNFPRNPQLYYAKYWTKIKGQ